MNQTETQTISLTPQPDGTLHGTSALTILSNECGLAAFVLLVPVVAYRIGEAPGGVAVANPADIPVSSAPPGPAQLVAGPSLNGEL